MRHYVAMALGSVIAGVAVGVAFGQGDLRTRVSAATAYIALGCIALSLMVGPLNLLRARANPVSSDLRRDLGIWGGIVGLVHVGVGLTVHLRGKMYQYFLPAPEAHTRLPIRVDAFGAANDLGLLAGGVLLVLLLLSSDLSLRRLGTARWKRWQRLNYVGALALVIHGVLYQIQERRRVALVALVIAVVVATSLLQGLGVQAFRRKRTAPPL
jgi:sulfoxide reductase heme-binding subunit YedZ